MLAKIDRRESRIIPRTTRKMLGLLFGPESGGANWAGGLGLADVRLDVIADGKEEITAVCHAPRDLDRARSDAPV